MALPVCLSCHQGQFGFLLPDDQIIPNAEEMVPAMYEYGQAVLEAFRGAEARRRRHRGQSWSQSRRGNTSGSG